MPSFGDQEPRRVRLARAGVARPSVAVRAAAVLGLALASLTGCAVKDRVTLAGATVLNKCTRSDESHPLKVRVYYLRAQERFRSAEFRALWESHDATLEDDLLAIEYTTVDPSSQQVLTLTRKGDMKKEARFIGVAADFCRAQEDCWRGIVPIGGGKSKVRFFFGEACVSVD